MKVVYVLPTAIQGVITVRPTGSDEGGYGVTNRSLARLPGALDTTQIVKEHTFADLV